LNIFGAPTIQENVKKIIYISNEVRKHAEKWTGYQKVATVSYCPIANPPIDIDTTLRERLGIPLNAFVLGRIGRADDSIFDQIGIRAFAEVVKSHSDLHYIIMSPPPILEKIVAEDKITNVHFLPPSGKEADVWAFHKALDVFAHFRFDGETSGVAIAESLILGNPVITHRSRIWNAHLEYLAPDFAKIAEIDDVSSYAKYIVEFMEIKQNNPLEWQKTRAAALSCGEYNFSSKIYSEKIRNMIAEL
jgi:glycosyltransferase involved in cell wall biosynthesis